MIASRRWNDIDILPSKEGEGWSVFKARKQIDASYSEIASLVARWLPANPLLIGAPGEKRFLPPVLISEFEAVALRTVRNNCRNMIIALAACGVVLLCTSAADPTSSVFLIGLMAIALGATIALDYYLGLRNRERLTERALFFRWLKVDSSARLGFLVWLVIALGMGVLQWLLLQHLGSMDSLFHNFGFMYADVSAGQYWRIITGPYLHYSMFHYLNNVMLLLFAGTLAFALFGRSVFLVFIIGNACAALAQMKFGGGDFDNYGGVSGGVYALFGALISAG
ncbi:rhomboid family intramembrane serine protease, partial [Xanthomonas theicola]